MKVSNASIKNKQIWVMGAIALITSLVPMNSQAQEGSGNSGGGRAKEGDLRHYIGKIDEYLLTGEGKKTFPEIVEYDRLHPTESFHALIQRVRPIVNIGPVEDAFQDDRDCVSHFEDLNNRYFVCNTNALPEVKLANDPSYLRIVFHELLVQTLLELPINKKVPSEYTISWRITENLHLETYQEWVPGKKKVVHNEFVTLVRKLFKDQSSTYDFQKINSLAWDTKGCTGVMIGGTGMTSLGSPNETRITGEINWYGFPEHMGLEFKHLITNSYQFLDYPNLPYSNDGPQLFTLIKANTMQANYGPSRLTVKLVDNTTIVVEAAINQDGPFYNQFAPVTGPSVTDSKYIPFVYFICKQ